MPLRTRLRATQNVCGVCGWVVARVRAGGGEAGVLYMSVGSPTHTHAHHHPRPLAALSVLTPPAVIACIALTVHRTRVRSSMHGSKQASRCTSEWLRPRAATAVCPERAPSALTHSLTGGPSIHPSIHPCCGGASAESASRDERHPSAGAGHRAGSATLPLVRGAVRTQCGAVQRAAPARPACRIAAPFDAGRVLVHRRHERLPTSSSSHARPPAARGPLPPSGLSAACPQAALSAARTDRSHCMRRSLRC
jgi:hypothetical protein